MRRVFQKITEGGLTAGFVGICVFLAGYEAYGFLMFHGCIPVLLIGLAGEILILVAVGGDG